MNASRKVPAVRTVHFGMRVVQTRFPGLGWQQDACASGVGVGDFNAGFKVSLFLIQGTIPKP